MLKGYDEYTWTEYGLDPSTHVYKSYVKRHRETYGC